MFSNKLIFNTTLWKTLTEKIKKKSKCSVIVNSTSMYSWKKKTWERSTFCICKYNLSLCLQMKVKQSRNRPGVAQRVPENLGSHFSMTFGTWRWWGCQPHASATFTPKKYSFHSFSLGAQSTPGPRYGQKEYVTEKSSDTTGNWSRDRPTSSAAP